MNCDEVFLCLPCAGSMGEMALSFCAYTVSAINSTKATCGAYAALGPQALAAPGAGAAASLCQSGAATLCSQVGAPPACKFAEPAC